MIGWMVLAVLLVWLAVILVRACLYRPLPAEKVSAAPVAVDPSPAVVLSCGTLAASRVLRLMSVPPVSIERRFSMLGFMVSPPRVRSS